MQLITSRDQISRAAEIAQQHLPDSSIMYSWLKLYLHDGPKIVEAMFYVDQWPEPRMMAGVTFQEAFGNKKFPYFCFFTTLKLHDSKIVENFLLELGEVMKVKEVGALEASAIDEMWTEALDNVFAHKLGLNASYGVWKNKLHTLTPEEIEKLSRKEITAPAGFEFGHLTPEEAEFVDSVWPHKYDGSLPWFEYRIPNFPTTCIRRVTADGRKILAGFELMHDIIGIMNHLYTLPEYRRRGLGTLVELKQCQEMIKFGCIPIKTVICGNVDGEKITEACPWWTYVKGVVWSRYGDAKMKVLFDAAH